MKALSRSLLALLGMAFLASPAVAQTLRPFFNNGVLVAPGTAAPRVQLIVRDSGGNARSGVVVTFEPACADQLRGDTPPYACVSTSDPLSVVTDTNGIATSPLYQADLTPGNAWLMATAELDAVRVSVPFYYRVGTSARSPLQIIQGDNQVVQMGFPIDVSMRAKIVDDRGRAVVGVPVTFTSSCAPSVPCLLPPTGTPLLLSDNQGFVDSAIRVANSVTGAYVVPLSIAGGGATFNFRFTNVGATKSATITTPLGDQVYLEMVGGPATCSLVQVQGLPKSIVGTPPNLIAAPYSPLRIVVDNCPAGSTLAFSLQHPGGLPPGAGVWSAQPQWQRLDSTNTIEGFWEFNLVDGGAGDADGAANGQIEAILSVAYGDLVTRNFQDLWWVGPVENGWGFSIVQHGNVLFIVVFAYDAAGQPTWYVVPGGTWNAEGNSFTGSLYQPRGRPLAEHTAANLVVGSPVGSVTLDFTDVISARLILRLGTTETVKFVTRQLFGARDERVVPQMLGDMWWAGPTRSGWGLVLQQQRSTVFGLLFTYRSDGSPTWYAMPTGIWVSPDTYEGLVYGTRSSAWPRDYDPAMLVADAVGAFKLQFGSGVPTALFDFAAAGSSTHFTLTRQPF